MSRFQLFSRDPRSLVATLLVCFAAFIVIGLMLVYAVHVVIKMTTVDPYREAQRTLDTLTNEEYHNFFTQSIDIFFKKDGINGIIDKVEEDLAEGQITMFVCHSLAHDIGHYGGYADHFDDIDSSLTKENLDFCGSGFMHGVEAQLAVEPYPTNIEKLYDFCKRVMPFNPYYAGCYHGAGHSFMEITRNVPDALKQCEFLKTDPDVTVEHCYRGVFSENANIMVQAGNEATKLFEYCSSLEGNMQYYCAEELNGLEIPGDVTLKEVGEYVTVCLNPAYGQPIQIGCMRSVAGVAVDRILGQGMTILPPEEIHALPDQYKRDYIHASYGAFMKSAAYDATLSFEPFCSSFESQELQSFCRGLGGN